MSDDILELVERALELDAAGRRELLEDVGRQDPDLRLELEAILSGEDDLRSEFLGAPAVEAMAEVLAEAEKGAGLREHPEAVGPYEVLSTLGEGGMGSVYLARQREPVDRLVAVKLIRGGLTSPEAVARFTAERQAMARLAHPAVAKIWEAGTTEDGFPYFVMEHVDGEPLVKFCDGRRLDVARRLELFVDICRGVEHAHQKGILHRDLKPSNILVAEVDGRATPKIIDFGIAKAIDDPLTDETVLTRFGIGTPNYMSPEAFGAGGAADVDTRTDVYALGIVLHQLLTGTLPLDTRELSASQVAERIARDPAPLPSRSFESLSSEARAAAATVRDTSPEALRRRLRGDLDWIVGKALEKEKERRYGSARELGEDVRRHLDLEPVSVGPPGRLYRTERWVRRNPALAAGLLVALLSLGLGVVGTFLGLVQAREEAQRAEAEAQKAQEALVDAEAATDFLVRLFEVSDPREAGGETISAARLLARGEERIERQLAERPLRRAELLQSLAEIYVRLHLFEDARRLLSTVIELRQGRLPEDDPGLAETRRRLGEVERLQAAEPVRADSPSDGERQPTANAEGGGSPPAV